MTLTRIAQNEVFACLCPCDLSLSPEMSVLYCLVISSLVDVLLATCLRLALLIIFKSFELEMSISIAGI